MILKSKQKTNKNEEQHPNENLKDLLQLADKFWENWGLDEKVKLPHTKIKQTKIIRSKTGIKENYTAKPKVKHSRNRSSQIISNQYFENKFKDKRNKIHLKEFQSSSKNLKLHNIFSNSFIILT